MLNNNGFTLVEVLVATTILLFTISIVYPFISFLYQERSVLKERRMASVLLHDELQNYLWFDQVLPATYTKTREYIPFHFQFSKEVERIKGCVSWENKKQTNETICFYGIPKQ